MPSQLDEDAVELGFWENAEGSLCIDDLEIPPAPTPVLSSDVPLSRLIITHLTVYNFKSYAGEQTIGPFDKSFTAVVGPNGSGKSNVIDALLFVFGRKSKDIRAKKVSALIHESKKHPDLTSCSVSVNFKMIKDLESGGFEEIPGSGLIVSKTAVKEPKDSSYYEINHRRVQFREVASTLRAYGIDLDYNRFLILQGEIESISLMSPKATVKDSSGMLEYMEDIVGSNRLIEPTKHFAERASALSELEKEKKMEVGLFKKELEELEGPKNRAIAFLRLENRRVLCENSILHVQRFKTEKELASITESKTKLADEIKLFKAEMANVQESKKALEAKLAEVAKKHDAIVKKRDEYSEEFKALCREDAANLLDIKHVKGKLQDAKKGLEDSQKEISKLTKQLEIYEKETEELLVKKNRLEGEKTVEEKKANEVMGSLKAETEKIQEKKDVKETKLIKLKENLYQIKSEMDLIKSELSIHMSGEKEEKEKLSKLQSDYKTNKESAKQEEALAQEEASQVKNLEKELCSFREQLSQAKEKELSLFQQHRDIRQKYEEARNSQQTSRNSSSLLQGLMKAKAAKKLPSGIYGRLGDLGAIDEKYDIAMSTACGRLDNIVTDTMTTAQQCVEYLKKHNLGYATFIALDQLRRFEQKVHQKIATPENVPRLFDLIRVNDPAILPAFYLGIADTLVATNLEQATRIGLGGHVRHRVVTLEGKMVEASGAMIGGGNTVIRGKIGSKVVENAVSDHELAEMCTQVNDLSKELFEVKQQCVLLDDKISQESNKLVSLQHSLKKRSLRCKAFQGQIEMISSQITEQEKKMNNSTVDETKVSELKAQIEAKNKIYTKSAQETSAVEKEVSELQAKILEVSKGKFSKAKKTVDQLKKKLTEVTEAVTKSNVNMKQSKTKIKKLENKIQSLENDITDKEKELQVLKDRRDAITERGQKTTELVAQQQDELAGFIDNQKHLKQEIATVTEKEHEMKLKEIEHKNELKGYEASEAEHRGYLRGFNSKLAKLKLTEVEDDPTVIPTLSEEEIKAMNLQNLKKDFDIMKVQLEDMQPELSSIEEYKKQEQTYNAKLEEQNRLTSDRIRQEKCKTWLHMKRVNEFFTAYYKITAKVQENYQILTGGGDAEFELIDKINPFEGIVYSVRPPKKAWKSMSNLSGGEKTLSSLALVFALHYYRTTPFYVMDEIDAALDETNVGTIGKFLIESQKNAQFIIVSLRNVMNELPDRLLGVVKVENCTKNFHLSHCTIWCKQEDEEGTDKSPTCKRCKVKK